MIKTFLIGNLTRDPEQVNISDKIVCKFSVAVNEMYVKQDGTRPVQFYNVIVWNKLAENCLKYLKKGSKIGLVGNPQNRCYEKDGEKKYVYEIVAEEIEFLFSAKQKDDKPELTPIDDDNLPF